MFGRLLSLCAAVGGLAPTAIFAQPTSGMVIEYNVPMQTRDHVTLVADVYRPSGDGRFPVLLQRTPYGKATDAYVAQEAVARGFMVVMQDVRGRYSSGGEWYPFKHEGTDGFDAVEWASALPHSNGKVGLIGGSYLGLAQLLTAMANPPHLAGICPDMTGSSYHDFIYQGGAFKQWQGEWWTSVLALDTFTRKYGEEPAPLTHVSVLPMNRYLLFNTQNINGKQFTEELAPYLFDWLQHSTYDGYWQQWAVEENYDRIRVPALTIAAWYDLFQGGSLRDYMGLRDHSSNGSASGVRRLMILIGGHEGNGRKVGQVDFGPDAASDEYGIALDWYDYLLLDKQNRFADETYPVRYFVMGKNEWRDETAWPPPQAKQTKYYLHSAGRANSATGDGTLSTESPSFEATDSFVYDPANPVPTVGGPVCGDAEHLPGGPQDQKDVEAREDVLVYSTPPLEQDLEATGPVMLDLFAESSAVDTDFTGKLVDVWPNGFVQNLTEGILRAGFRDSPLAKPSPIMPGKMYEYRIDLWSTSNVFLKGHRIRLEISSSNFPRFDRNLNTGGNSATDSRFVKANNTIVHDKEHPSALILPILAN